MRDLSGKRFEEIIQSESNPTFRLAQKLLGKPSVRAKEGKFLIEGLRIVRDANPSQIRKILVTEHPSKEVKAYLSALPEEELRKVLVFKENLIRKMESTENGQGILAIVEPGEQKTFQAEEESLILLLDGIRDPGNLGTILRTAEAAGADRILLSGDTTDVYAPKVLRSSMGSIFRLPCETGQNLPERISDLRKQGFRILGARLQEASSYTKMELKGRIALVIGNEANGISPDVNSCIDEGVFIPMHGEIESLNAAIATAILLFEILRQRDNF